MAALNNRVKSDAIVLCCSYDLRTCDHACELIRSGFADTLLLSGNTGNWTRHIWSEPEAEIYYRRALINGVANDSMEFSNKTATRYDPPRRVFLVRSVTFASNTHGHKKVINSSAIGSAIHFLRSSYLRNSTTNMTRPIPR
jgi:hypothetical protein